MRIWWYTPLLFVAVESELNWAFRVLLSTETVPLPWRIACSILSSSCLIASGASSSVTNFSPLTLTFTPACSAFAIASVKDFEISVCLAIESFNFCSACSTAFLKSSSFPGVKVNLISLSNFTPALVASSTTLDNLSLALDTNSVRPSIVLICPSMSAFASFAVL